MSAPLFPHEPNDRSPATLRAAAGQRQGRGEGLADGPPMDLVALGEGVHRETLHPLVSTDALEQFHPRQLLLPSSGGLPRRRKVTSTTNVASDTFTYGFRFAVACPKISGVPGRIRARASNLHYPDRGPR